MESLPWSLLASKPGRSVSTTIVGVNLRAAWIRSGRNAQKTTMKFAQFAFVMKVLVPEMTYSSPSDAARS